MSTSDGTVVRTVQILDNGSPIDRFSIAILSEGYKSSELGQFATDASAFVKQLSQTAPFHLVMNSINVYRVEVSSTDSGADDPKTCGSGANLVTCGGSGATAKTYFDATFCSDGQTQRLLGVNATTVDQVAKAQVPGYDLAIVVVNTAVYGGSGGSVAVYSLASNAVEIAIHEMGHTAFAFADEYEYLAGCASGEAGHNNHPAMEPGEVNVTITNANSRTGLKWGRFVEPSTPLPTTVNPDCTKCDPQGSSVPTGRVGAFEGAHYFHCGAYRPEFDCKMRTLGMPFCRVCQDAILRKMIDFSPLTFRFAWKGVGGDQGIYNGFGSDSDQDDIPGRGTSTGPALSSYLGTFMAWKGIFRDQGIYYSRQTHIDRVTWDSQRSVPGVGTSTGPALAVFQNKLHMAWKGIEGDQGIWFTTLDISDTWAPQRNVPGVGTSTRPALAVFRGLLFMA